jgi:predicted DNA-binding transcriptional regulator AlpA
MPLVRPAPLAKDLGVSLSSVFRWRKAGDFPPAYRLGPGSIAFDKAEVEAWLAARREPKADTAHAEQVQR